MNENETDIRVIVISRTFADIAGLPLYEGDVIDPVNLQKLPERVKKHFGDVGYNVIRPKLILHKIGLLRFPRYEVMAGAYGDSKILVFYVDELPGNIEQLILQAAAEIKDTTTGFS